MNKHGLSRTIPPDIKYQIRKEAYFGCVHCGIAFIDYEHIDPEFSDAKKHDPSKMTLLCPEMNQKKERGFLSKETVWGWKRNPWGKQTGHCHDSFDVGYESFCIWIGNTKVEKIEKIISIDDTCILSIKSPEEPNSPFRLSAIFHDDKNNKTLEIKNNEWIANSESFDIICSNGKIGIKKSDGTFALKIACYPPKQIVIEEINMYYNGMKILTNQNGFEIVGPNGNKANIGGKLLTAINEGCSLFSFFTNKNSIELGAGCQISPLTETMPSKPVRSTKCPVNSDCPCGQNRKYKKCCYPKYDYSL